MNINGIQFDPQELMSKSELIDYLSQNGASDRALSKIRDDHYEKYGNELIWRYPISDGIHLGTYIVAVKDGFLSLPFNTIDEDDYELLELEEARLLEVSDLAMFVDDWKSYSSDLMKSMRDMMFALKGE